MIRFEERQWMYHGSPHTDLTHLKTDPGEMMLDRAVGSHFAADPVVSRRFAKGLYRSKLSQWDGWGPKPKPVEGTLYRAKAPTHSQLYVVPQKRYPSSVPGHPSTMESDQHAIGAHI